MTDQPRAPISTPISTSGDRFVRDDVLQQALRLAVGGDPTFVATPNGWPDEPFRSFAGVEETCGDEDALIAGLDGVEIAVTHVAPFTEKVIRAAPALRYIGVGRGGPVNVDLAAAAAAGITVANAPGRNAVAVAEFTIGLVLSACRRITESHVSLTEPEWRGAFYRYEEAGIELAGNTVGLIGFGAVGHRVGRLLVAFGARVLAYDPHIDQQLITDQGCEPVATLGELLERSPILSLHPRVTAETRGMVGADQLARLPRGAVLVNSARGALLDHSALCDALDSGRLRAAALDTYDVEPLPADSRLYATPNLTMSPHIAGATEQSAHKAAEMVAADVARFLAGEPLRFPVVSPATAGRAGGHATGPMRTP